MPAENPASVYGLLGFTHGTQLAVDCRAAAAEREAAGLTEELVPVAVGCEDLDQALEAAQSAALFAGAAK